jgi:hypothetical protein
MNIDLDQTSPKVLSCLERLANKLDNIAIALDLASACNRDDIDNRLDPDDIVTESTAVAAIEQYFVDLAEHKEGVLSDLEQNAANAYKKTVWTVWETVLSSLKRSEQRDAAAGIYPMQSLGLAVVLGSTTVHREVFRAFMVQEPVGSLGEWGMGFLCVQGKHCTTDAFQPHTSSDSGHTKPRKRNPRHPCKVCVMAWIHNAWPCMMAHLRTDPG